jgi:hypothetical protein
MPFHLRCGIMAWMGSTGGGNLHASIKAPETHRDDRPPPYPSGTFRGCLAAPFSFVSHALSGGIMPRMTAPEAGTSTPRIKTPETHRNDRPRPYPLGTSRGCIAMPFSFADARPFRGPFASPFPPQREAKRPPRRKSQGKDQNKTRRSDHHGNNEAEAHEKTRRFASSPSFHFGGHGGAAADRAHRHREPRGDRRAPVLLRPASIRLCLCFTCVFGVKISAGEAPGTLG